MFGSQVIASSGVAHGSLYLIKNEAIVFNLHALRYEFALPSVARRALSPDLYLSIGSEADNVFSAKFRIFHCLTNDSHYLGAITG